VFGPDSSSRFEELNRREATDTAILYAFDLIEDDGGGYAQSQIPRSQGRAGTAAAQYSGWHPIQ
jgi:hypothetical protein